MSETVHYVGTATEIGSITSEKTISFVTKTLKELNSKCEGDDVCVWLADEFYPDFFIYNKMLYKIHREENDVDDDIAESSYNADGTISFSLKYYNGGAGFEEMLTDAFDKMKSKLTKIELEEEAIIAFEKTESEGHFPNHTDRDIWIKGYVFAKMNN